MDSSCSELVDGLGDDSSWASSGVVVATEFVVGLAGGQDLPHGCEDGAFDLTRAT